MKRSRLKVLHEQIDALKSINNRQGLEIDNLNKEINDLKNKEEITKVKFKVMIKNFENQKIMTLEYKKLFQNLKLIERHAGRKAYFEKEVVKRRSNDDINVI